MAEPQQMGVCVEFAFFRLTCTSEDRKRTCPGEII